jgi:hypothetical protein
MSATEYKVGQRLDFYVNEIVFSGAIVTFREDKKNGRWRLTVRDDAERIHLLWSTDVANTDGVRAYGHTIDLAAAELMAKEHLAGRSPTGGVTATLNVLAGAVLQLMGARP